MQRNWMNCRWQSWRRNTLILAIAALSLGCTMTARAQRLPKTVTPLHYTLRLTPDLQKAVYAGSETIAVKLATPSDSITLNAIEIQFSKVSIDDNGQKLTGSVTLDEGEQQATLHFPRTISAGEHRLHIAFTGTLNGELRGFYLSKTARRNYAVTQFESTDARRAFPCFDEPAMKATFDVTLVVDKGDTAISNTNIVSDTPVDSGARHALHFAVTPRMSTYLVAFLVGDFQCVSGSSDGVPIRACATPDQVQYGRFALKAAEFVLHYYNTYFGIRYPMPKLDMIALPDFEAGAMENFGAITYRETDLLVDEQHASVDALKRVASVVAHEMAHQWFGDMVTMEWWNNIWLNEGFATWMENKPVEAWKPEWKISQSVAANTQTTLNLDARRVTRTIRAEANTPDEINEMFDGISYGKAGAVLLMMENYEGKEVFRQGVHNYLAAHLYGNATAEDFWNAQTAASHKPIDRIMASFVVQPGVPIVKVSDAVNGAVAVTQQRFFLNPGVTAKPQTWEIPVCVADGNGQNCQLLDQPQQRLAATHDSFLNAGGKGYYRTQYAAATLHTLATEAESTLTPEERISLLGDSWALAQANEAKVGDFLNLAARMADDSNSEVVRTVIEDVNAIAERVAATDSDRSQLSAWIRRVYGPAYQRLGAPSKADSPETRELRAELLRFVAGTGEDKSLIAEAKQITAQNLADPASTDPTLAQNALEIASLFGDRKLFDRLQHLAENSGNPQIRSSSLRALARFQDPALETRALEYSVSGRVRNQDVASMLEIELINRSTQTVAWKFIQNQFSAVLAQLTASSGASMVGSTGHFCSAEMQQQVTSFFAAHRVPSSAHALARATDQIGDCTTLRANQQANLEAWLSTH